MSLGGEREVRWTSRIIMKLLCSGSCPRTVASFLQQTASKRVEWVSIRPLWHRLIRHAEPQSSSCGPKDNTGRLLVRQCCASDPALSAPSPSTCELACVRGWSANIPYAHTHISPISRRASIHTHIHTSTIPSAVETSFPLNLIMAKAISLM